MISLALLVAIPGILTILLGNSKMQNYVAGKLTRSLSEKVDSEVRIGYVNYKLFNTFRLKDVYLEDLSGDTLAAASSIDAKFRFWRILKKEIVVTQLDVNHFTGNLYIDSIGTTNLNFLLEAFKKDDRKKEFGLVFSLRDVKLTNSVFQLRKEDRSGKIPERKGFNGNNFRFQDIDAHVAVDYWKGDSLVATIHNLHTQERSGLRVEGLKAGVVGYKQGFSFPDFELKLPHSQIKIDSLEMAYDSIADMQDFVNRVRWNAVIKPSTVTLADLKAFVPNFSKLLDPVQVRANLNGSISNFRAKDIELDYRNSFLFRANVDMNGLPNIEETFIYADVSDLRVNRVELQDFIAKITNTPFMLPQELNRLGNMKWRGNITGFFSNLVSYGSLGTDVGVLRTDILIQLENKLRDVHYNGSLHSSNFNLGRLLADQTFGKTAFKLSTKGSKRYQQPVRGEVHGEVNEFFLNEYTYRNIQLDGNYDSNGFEGDMLINDPGIDATFNGIVDLSGALPVFNFDFGVTHVDLYALNLLERYEGASLSFHANTNLVGNSLDNMNGFLEFDDFRFINKGKEWSPGSILLESKMDESSHFSVSSDLLEASFDGKFKYSTLFDSFNSFVKMYLPAFSGKNVTKTKNTKSHKNLIDFDLTINNTEFFTEVFEFPVVLKGRTVLSGTLDDENGKIELNSSTPQLNFGKSEFDDFAFTLNNENEQLNFDLSSVYNLPKDKIDFTFRLGAKQDSVMSHLVWYNNDTTVFAGEIQAYTHIKNQNNLTSATTRFLPTEIALAEASWRLEPSTIEILEDMSIDIQAFSLINNDQYILIDGVASKAREDAVSVEIQDVDVGYFLQLLRFSTVEINGSTSGIVAVNSVFHQPIIESNLLVENTLLNNTPVGNATIYTGWSPGDSELLVSGTFTDENNYITLANGSYSFESDSINFVFDANRLNIGFLEKWLGSVANDITGRASGTLRMAGPTKNIAFEGDVFAENASFSIDYLKTRYSFTDSIYLRRNRIDMKNITVKDVEGNRGVLNGVFSHDGAFRDIDYDLRITANNVLALNTSVKDNDFFYGKAYATGDVRISGTDEVVNIDVNVTSQPRTKVYISAGSAAVAAENNFITFYNAADTTSLEEQRVTAPVASEVVMNLSMNLDITPDAEIQFVISPLEGDMIVGNGEGNLRLLLRGEDDFKMYGGVTIEKGNYLFTLENLLRKQFKIEQGSTVNWSGDPMRAQLNIKATHGVTASLYDLMSDDILRTTDRTSVPVNAVLYITEEMLQPDIRFDVELPSSDETLKMQVKNLINTEEMMNRQIVYLLLFGKFYTPEYNRSSDAMTAANFSHISSLASSAFLGQANNYLSQLIENVTFGVNIRSTGYGDAVSQEYETAINYQPNNRLLVNGNFGYRDDNFAKNKIIGDLDVEYLLAEKSRWRLKFFNHTVDRYSMKSAPFIRGVGIMYKQDFNNFNELVERMKIRRNKIEIAEGAMDSATENDQHEVQVKPNEIRQSTDSIGN